MLISQNLHSLSEQTLDPLPQHIQSLVVSRGLDMRSFIPALLISCTSFSKALEYIFHLIPFYISQNRSGNSCIFKSHPFIHSDFPIHAGEDRFLSPPFLLSGKITHHQLPGKPLSAMFRKNFQAKKHIVLAIRHT